MAVAGPFEGERRVGWRRREPYWYVKVYVGYPAVEVKHMFHTREQAEAYFQLFEVALRRPGVYNVEKFNAEIEGMLDRVVNGWDPECVWREVMDDG